MKTLTGYLQQDGSRVRRAVIGALRDLGSTAAPAREIVASLAEQDPDGRVRNLAEAALAKLNTNGPAPGELSKLRSELEKLRKDNTDLKGRLHRLESK